MDKVMNVVNWLLNHKAEILMFIGQVVGFASIIVKLTPTLKDDNFLLPIVKFIGKYVALNKTVTEEDRPK